MVKSHPLTFLATNIGRITIAWNDIHFFVFTMFWRMNGNDPAKAMDIFFALRADSAQRDITAGLANSALAPWPELQQQAISALNAIGKLAGRRNAFVHAMWIFESQEGDIEHKSLFAPSSPKLSAKDIATELEQLGAEIEALKITVAKVTIAIEEKFKPSKQQALAKLLLEYQPQPGEPTPMQAAPGLPATPKPGGEPPQSSGE